jgi:hypothetical protein
MNNYVGIWDWLLGERITVELPSPNGGSKKVQVSKRWFEQMQREGKIRPINIREPPEPPFEKAQIPPPKSNRAVTKQELLSLVAQGLKDVEATIGQQTAEVQALYEQGKRAFLEGQARAQETDWSRIVALSLPELIVMNQYLFATAFVSAWYSIQGDTNRRTEAMSPACLLVSALVGCSPEEALHRYMKFERVWLELLRGSGT